MNESNIIQGIMDMGPQHIWWAVVGPYSVAEIIDSFPSLESAHAELDWMAGFPLLHPDDRPTHEQRVEIKSMLVQHIANTYIK